MSHVIRVLAGAAGVGALLFLPAIPASAQPRPSVTADGLIYVSAVAGDSGDIKAQTAQALAAIGGRLSGAGSSLANAASVLVVLRNVADAPGVNEVFAQQWPKDPPARTTIVVAQPLSKAGALVELSVVAIPTGAERVVVQPAGWMKPPSPYSYGIKTGNTLFLAGLINRNPMDNTMTAGDITVQTKMVMDAAVAILKEAGMTMADVVSSRIFLADETTFQAMNTTYRTYFPASPPARATVKAALPSSASLIEITMIALKDPSRKAVIPPNADGTPGRPGANLSPAIQVGKRLFLAGMTGSTAATKGNVRAQTVEVMARLGRALTAAGYGWADVVEETMFITDITGLGDVEAATAAYVKGQPARVVLGTPLMRADAAVEIMVTAVKP